MGASWWLEQASSVWDALTFAFIDYEVLHTIYSDAIVSKYEAWQYYL